ncbi:DNA helicase B [Eleutherodactylus coqui]|uniref:DNA helicase B n=1 Tax=Eleutherodactylus coqui TaxID=57060 RepID=UPI0034617B74
MSGSRGRSRGRGAGTVELRGQLLPVKDLALDTGGSDGDSDGPNDSDPEFLDADEIEGGARQVRSWRVQRTRVLIKTEASQEYIVNGPFVLDDPWWTATVRVKPLQSQNYATEPPSYELHDGSLGKGSNLPLFLHKCGVTGPVSKDFMDWLPRYPPVSFSTLMELARDFNREENKNILPYLEKNSFAAFTFLALQIPLVLKYLPKLLPSKIRSLFVVDANYQKSFEEPPHSILCEIELMLANDPWKLGFGMIMFQELHLCGCEATWESFLQCEDLLKKIPPLKMNALIIYAEIKKRCMELGDVYVELSELTTAVTNAQDMSTEGAWEALQFLKEHGIVVMEQQKIFLYSWYWYEVSIADYIQKIILRNSWNFDIDDIFGNDACAEKNPDNQDTLHSQTAAHPADAGEGSGEKVTEPKPSTQLDADQKEAAKRILANPVTVISGKGGCGKTTVVSLVFKSVMEKENNEIAQACKALEEDIGVSDEWFCDDKTPSSNHKNLIRVLLTAPTGKAASLLKKKTGLPAATLHQVTCSYSNWRKLNSDEIKWKFSNVEALVVDEASLVSVRIFSAVLKLLYTHGKLAKLVILGDVRQLPSIEPGNMLADTFTFLSSLNWAIELRTNHRAESQIIVDNATRISNRSAVEFDTFVHIDGMKSSEMPSEDSKFILVSLADDVDLSTAILALLKSGPGLEDDKHSQFIAFRRKDCLLINELCCKHYSDHTMKDSRSKYDFRCGDKVCCTKNAYVKDLLSRLGNCSKDSQEDPSSGIVTVSQPQLDEAKLPLEARNGIEDDDRLCNGEIFFITDDVEKDNIRELTLSDGEDRQYTLNYKALRSLSKLRHAWARTIHTFQGSEEDTVVYVLGAAGRQNWKHVYTAVTRGRKRVYIIAKNDQLDKAIANKARERKTRLKQRLKDKLTQNRTSEQPTAMPPTYPESSQMAEKQEPDVTRTSPPLPYTQLKTPPRFSCPPVPTTPKACSSTSGDWLEGAEHTMHAQPDHLQGCTLEESPLQKRAASPWDGSETPKKIRVKSYLDSTEESPTNSREFQLLSLQSPCHKNSSSPQCEKHPSTQDPALKGSARASRVLTYDSSPAPEG